VLGQPSYVMLCRTIQLLALLGRQGPRPGTRRFADTLIGMIKVHSILP
jgi:hypothetical protein